MREIELKAVVPDEKACHARCLAAGAIPVFEGLLEDRRYDYPDRRLTMIDVVLRLRVQRAGDAVSAMLDWKGPASYEGGYKHRDETSVPVGEPTGMMHILEALGFVVTRAVDRNVRVLTLGGATIRFERFARMDPLLEVEGAPDAIERAIAVSGIPRASFVPDRLWQFVQRYESRTGQRAAICADEFAGEYRYAITDA